MTSMFEAQLRRLKDSLGLVEDQEVAQALGMTKAAFSYRKRSHNFPEEKLVDMKARYPGLDIAYVLTGDRWSEADRVAFDRFSAGAVAVGSTPSELAALISDRVHPTARLVYEALDNKMVRSLIETLLWCDDDSIDLLTRVAARMRGRSAIPFGQRGEVARHSLSDLFDAATRKDGPAPKVDPARSGGDKGLGATDAVNGGLQVDGKMAYGSRNRPVRADSKPARKAAKKTAKR